MSPIIQEPPFLGSIGENKNNGLRKENRKLRVMLGSSQIEVLAVFLVVYALIVVRKVGRFKVEVWMAMLIGAVLLLAMGIIDLPAAVASLNTGVLLFLFGTFLIVGIMIQTGLLQYLALYFLRMARTPSLLLLLVIGFVSLASAFLVNDAVVLVTTPIVITACSVVKLKKTPYLLAVALSSNIGSALTPIGNPQNVLIKIESGISTLFFMERMLLPVLFSMAAEYLILKAIYRADLDVQFEFEMPEPGETLSNRGRAMAGGVIAAATVCGFLTSDITGVPIALVAVMGGTAALLVSSDRRQMIKNIDWGTLIFFASMFIVMGTVAASGLLDGLISAFGTTLFAQGSTSIVSIFGLSLVVSQITSNVPFVALMLPIFNSVGASASQWLALAAGSTLAGNLTLLGAAANIIVLEAAETRGATFSYGEFLKAGIPVSLATCAIAVLLLSLGL
jgi:Na+/H+ antiporter NhaD/arsenite permease-like protein